MEESASGKIVKQPEKQHMRVLEEFLWDDCRELSSANTSAYDCCTMPMSGSSVKNCIDNINHQTPSFNKSYEIWSNTSFRGNTPALLQAGTNHELKMPLESEHVAHMKQGYCNMSDPVKYDYEPEGALTSLNQCTNNTASVRPTITNWSHTGGVYSSRLVLMVEGDSHMKRHLGDKHKLSPITNSTPDCGSNKNNTTIMNTSLSTLACKNGVSIMSERNMRVCDVTPLSLVGKKNLCATPGITTMDKSNDITQLTVISKKEEVTPVTVMGKIKDLIPFAAVDPKNGVKSVSPTDQRHRHKDASVIKGLLSVKDDTIILPTASDVVDMPARLGTEHNNFATNDDAVLSAANNLAGGYIPVPISMKILLSKMSVGTQTENGRLPNLLVDVACQTGEDDTAAGCKTMMDCQINTKGPELLFSIFAATVAEETTKDASDGLPTINDIASTSTFAERYDIMNACEQPVTNPDNNLVLECTDQGKSENSNLQQVIAQGKGISEEDNSKDTQQIASGNNPDQDVDQHLQQSKSSDRDVDQIQCDHLLQVDNSYNDNNLQHITANCDKSRCNNFHVVILGKDMDRDDSQSLQAMHGSGLHAGNTGLKMCAIEAGRQGCVEENADHLFIERYPEKKSDAISNGVNSNGNCFDGSIQTTV